MDPRAAFLFVSNKHSYGTPIRQYHLVYRDENLDFLAVVGFKLQGLGGGLLNHF